MSNPFDLLAWLLGVAALIGLANHHTVRLPHTIGLLVGGLFLALLLIAGDRLVPALGLRGVLHAMLDRVDLPQTLLNGFLSFLLFAGAMELDLQDLLQRKWTILALALGGTLISTVLIGFGFYGIVAALGLGVPLIWCFLFGALISPTDPVSVMDVLRRVGVTPGMRAVVAGESLFNDGIGIVLFVVCAQLAFGAAGSVTPLLILRLFLLQALGGVLFGLATGWLVYEAMRRTDDRNLELILSLALVSVTYSVSGLLGVSGPVAVVVAGIIIGNQGARFAMSAETREHLQRFWSLVEELLNGLLFLLLGLEIAALEPNWLRFSAAAASVPLALASRWCSVTLAALPLNLNETRKFTGLAILTWGGLRGGISVALALSLPAGPDRDLLLAACYGVVLFTIIVQGLTFGRVVSWLMGR
jgi:CPA1 family monovalent cation:H+ antiporter